MEITLKVNVMQLSASQPAGDGKSFFLKFVLKKSTCF